MLLYGPAKILIRCSSRISLSLDILSHDVGRVELLPRAPSVCRRACSGATLTYASNADDALREGMMRVGDDENG